VADQQPRAPVPSWRPGHFVWPRGRTKLVLFGGIGTRTGDAERSFAGLIRYLSQHGGFDPRRDVLEGTFTGSDSGGLWRPRPYLPVDTRRPLLDIAESVANTMEWYRGALPNDAQLCLLGYSLGGVAALDGATLAVVRDRAGWQGRIAAVVTIAAPVRGCNAGPLMNWAWLATAEPDPLGQAGRDLDARWHDAEEQQRLERRAGFLRDSGAAVLTLADPDDAVVRPDEALLPAPGQSRDDLLVPVRTVRPGTYGHGALLDEPALWQRVLNLIGAQEAGSGPPPPDPIDAELEALKARLRSEGRIR
jgi:hypothetical protein